MSLARTRIATLAALLALACTARARAYSGPAQESQQPTAAGGTARAVGSVKGIIGNAITLATDAGSTVSVLMQDSTLLVRVAPGEKDLKDAVPMQLQDVHAGDRVFIRGSFSADGKSIVASSAVVMKEEDLTARQAREREDWQKRGVGGLVSTIDPGSGTITLSSQNAGGGKVITVHLSKDTILRRYAPDSVKFDEATRGTLDQIKSGDQLRARGARSADGTELTAEEIVSGTFRNIAGTVALVDSSLGTVSVMDLVTKKTVSLKISSDSQLRKLPPMVAQRIAARLKGQSPEGGSGASAAAGASGGDKAESMRQTGTDPSGHPGGPRASGPPDFQQMLNRMPAVTVADLQKGDAVMIVSTQGSANAPPTAITLLTGVEPILTASPNGDRAAMLLSPWNLGGSAPDSGAGTTP